MSENAPDTSAPPGDAPVSPEDIGHPKGTLAIVAVFGLLFLVGWFAMYFYFLGRGAPHP